MGEDEVCNVPVGLKIQGHLRFTGVGSRRNPRPCEAQGSARIDAAVLTGDDCRILLTRREHRHAVTAADLEIDLGLRRSKVVSRSVPGGHAAGFDPRGEHLLGRRVTCCSTRIVDSGVRDTAVISACRSRAA